jgi:hypothetical protein
MDFVNRIEDEHRALLQVPRQLDGAQPGYPRRRAAPTLVIAAKRLGRFPKSLWRNASVLDGCRTSASVHGALFIISPVSF